jgi:protease-4
MRDFFKQTFASLIGSVLGLFVFFGLGTFGLIVLLVSVASKDTGPQVKDKSILVFDLSIDISDTNRRSSTSELLEEAVSGENDDSVTLRTVLDTIEKATKDKRIIGIFLDGSHDGGGSAGFATLKEVREALERFRAAGKKIIAYNVDWGKKDYYLASVADTIMLNPMGTVEINGLRSEPLFLSGALEKYGIGVQVIRVGKFKSAVEPYILKQLSAESRQQTQVLLGGLWKDWNQSISKSRQFDAKRLQNVADTQGFLTAEEALKNRLVDKIVYTDEVIAELKKVTESKEEDRSFRQISLTNYAKIDRRNSKNKSSENKVAVIYAEGEIVEGQGGARNIGGDRFARQLRKLRLNKNVKAVVLRVNSPGGSATASEIIQREVRLIRKEKPVIVSMGDVAASGGYWISTYGDRIFAEPNTITGSIGVFGLLFNFQKLANNNGITWDVVKTAKLADSDTASRPKTPQEIALYQRLVDGIYTKFIDKVAESRKISKEKVQEIAQGRVWSGEDAKALGLVDEIGGIDAAIAYAAKQAKLGDNWELEEHPKARSLEERILEQLSGNQTLQKSQAKDPLTTEFLKLQTEVETLQNMNDSKGVYVRLPFNLQIK